MKIIIQKARQLCEMLKLMFENNLNNVNNSVKIQIIPGICGFFQNTIITPALTRKFWHPNLRVITIYKKYFQVIWDALSLKLLFHINFPASYFRKCIEGRSSKDLINLLIFLATKSSGAKNMTRINY